MLESRRVIFIWVVLVVMRISLSNGQHETAHVPDHQQELEIFGCGGFVRSHHSLDLTKMEIKLFTKQGSLKMKTECAPTTGYYFIPLEGKGDYILKISPPEGWTFDPPEYSIKFDGVSDMCSKGIDINFDFKGFSVSGKIFTEGFVEGPEGVLFTLTGKDDLFLKTRSKAGGHFAFDSIPPGEFTLRSSHTGVTFSKDTFTFTVKENFKVENQIIVSGYEINGKVISDKVGVEGVTLVLVGDNDVKGIQNCQPGKPIEGFTLPENTPTIVICHQASDQVGIFRFKNVTPGKYTVIPVYKGNNIVYNVSPDRIDFDLNHKSIELKNFEVDGFTVIGKVKGLSGATILVDGEIRATSGQDGSFSIPKMKQGTYDFQINAEKFQFEKQKIKIMASNPILPDFLPSKFLVCGTVKLVRQSSNAQLFLNFEKVIAEAKEIQREIVSDTSSKELCYFLSAGNYSVRVESIPEKFFIPETQLLQVPTGKRFTFTEFNGFISGKVLCPLFPNGKCEVKIQLTLKGTGAIVAEDESKDGTFKFTQLESGEYEIRVLNTNYCWNNQKIVTKLRNSNIESIEFIQTGFALTLTSSHATKVKISTKQKKVKILEEVLLAKDEIKKFCLKEYSSEGYDLQPISCHIFEKTLYNFILEKNEPTDIKLLAVLHEYSGMIQTNAPLTNLQAKRNDQIQETEQLHFREEKNGQFNYDFKVVGKSGESITLHFFSYDFMFTPKVINFVGASDCQTDVFQVTGQKSQVIKGKLDPPIGGVEIRIDLIGDPDSTTFVTTDSKGEYIAGPFIHDEGFKVTPRMSGYNFKSLGDGYSFNALQFAKIQVNVAEIDSQSAVGSVLLSLSGPNAYRQNKVTDANGEFVFGDLEPGTYFLKALLKEFIFEPSALHIELQEEESKKVKLGARRESFSMFGQLSSLSGDVMPNLMLSAQGQGNCSEYAEEGVTDENGNFRIWSLKSFCQYKVTVVKKEDYSLRVERTIPEILDVKVMGDIQNVTFVIIQPVKRIDVSLRCKTKNIRNLESLKALVYSSKSPDTPIHSVSFNGIPYIILPPLPKDSLDYFIVFESSLSKSNFQYDLPQQINFTANEAYKHFSFDFTVEVIHHDQEIGKSSYLAFTFIIFVFLVIINFERLSAYLKEAIDRYLQSTGAGSKRKLKPKSQ